MLLVAIIRFARVLGILQLRKRLRLHQVERAVLVRAVRRCVAQPLERIPVCLCHNLNLSATCPEKNSGPPLGQLLPT